MVKGLKNAYLMHFSSLHSWFHCRGCYYLKCSSSLSQSLCKGQIKGQKTFFGQNSFQLMYNHKPKSNAPLRKNHKTADRKGGGSTLTVSLTVKYPFFFLTTSLIGYINSKKFKYLRKQSHVSIIVMVGGIVH